MSHSSWRTPAIIIACGSIILIIGNGLRSGSGLFLQPMTMAHGWTRETFSLAIGLQNIFWGLGGPFFGAICDKFGAGRTLVTGAVLMALGYYGMSQAQTGAALVWSAGVLIGFGVSGSGLAIVLSVFARQVETRYRSVVLGVGTAAGSMGQFVMLPVGQALIDAYGWQQALVLQALMVVLIIPLSLAMAGKPAARPFAGHADQSIAEAVKTAVRDRSFVLLFFGYFTCGFQTIFIGVHLPSYLVDRGLSPTLGAAAIATVGLFNVIGSLTSGWLGGRYSKRYLLAGIYLCRSLVTAVFILLPLSTLSVYLFSAFIGVFWLSTVPLTQGLVGQRWGLRYMSTLVGVIFLGHQVGSFLGAWLGGVIFDATGSYTIAWWLIIGSGVYAAILHLPIRETPLRPSPAMA
ncbi:MAG: MFS transporter [Betaproteobacteria bacterium]|nr:MFS transporter [Betaproteobacteria bacterium]